MSVCRNSRPLNNNYYNQIGNMLLWYDANDRSTLLKNDNSVVTSNGDFVAKIKNKAPKYTNQFNLTSIGTNVNSYNTTLTKPSVFTSNVSNTGFVTNGNPLIPTGYTVLMVYKSTGNSPQGNYGLFTKNSLWTTADPVEIYNTNHSIGNNEGVRSVFQGSNVGTATSTPVLFTSQFSTANNNYYAYLNGTLNTSGNTTRYLDANVPLYIANRFETALSSSMYLCEFIMYDTAISDNARVYFEGYLASKWGIQSLLPAGHTYKATIPPLIPTTYTTLNTPLCWYDTLDISTLLNSSNNVINGTNGEFVTTIKNKAPNFKGIYNLTSIANNVNSYNTSMTKPSIFTNYLTTTGFKTSSTSPPLPTKYTIFVVYKPTGNGYNGGTVFAKSNLIGATGANGLSTSGTHRYFSNNNAGGLYNDVVSSFNMNTVQSTPVIVVDTLNKSALTFTEYVNGTLTASSSSVNYYTDETTTTPLYVGNHPTNYVYSSLYFCEMLVYDYELTTTSRVYIEGYLANKWGIQSLLPSNHTYKSSTPPLTPDKYSVS